MDVKFSDVLRVYKHLLEEKGANDFVVDGMTGFIFGNRFNSAMNPALVNSDIRRVSESYNHEKILKAAWENRKPIILAKFTCHHLRHTFCTKLCKNESNLKVIQ